jgi:hypothetical protein
LIFTDIPNRCPVPNRGGAAVGIAGGLDYTG